MAKKVDNDYGVAWKLDNNVGRIGAKLGSSSNYSEIPINSHEEFQSLLILLQGSKAVFYDSEKRFFATVP